MTLSTRSLPIVIVLALALGAPAFGQAATAPAPAAAEQAQDLILQWRMGEQMADPERVDRFLEDPELRLTEAQKDKVKALVEAARAARRKFMEEQKAAIEKLRGEVAAAVQAAEDAKLSAAPLIQEIIKQKLDVPGLAAQMRPLLTAGQRELFDARLKERVIRPGQGLGDQESDQQGLERFLASREFAFTQAQQDKLRQIAQDARAARQQFLQERQAPMDKLQRELGEVRRQVEQSKVKEMAVPIRDLLSQAPSAREVLGKIRSELTPSQQQLFDTKLSDWEERMKERGGRE